MKITIMMTFFFGSLMVSNSSFASGELNQVLKTEETKQSASTKKRRRKKVQMCHDCGKPEVECECEGEGHGVDHDGHDH